MRSFRLKNFDYPLFFRPWIFAYQKWIDGKVPSLDVRKTAMKLVEIEICCDAQDMKLQEEYAHSTTKLRNFSSHNAVWNW